MAAFETLVTRALISDNKEAWVELANVARKHGREDLAEAAALVTKDWAGLGMAVDAAIWSLDPNTAIAIAVRAARRALERERSAGRDPDKRSLAAVDAVLSSKVTDEMVADAWDAVSAVEKNRFSARAAAKSAAWAAQAFNDKTTNTRAYYGTNAAVKAVAWSAANAEWICGEGVNERRSQLIDMFYCTCEVRDSSGKEVSPQT